jgi:hypothetical protein
LAIVYPPEERSALEAAGLLERVKIGFACGRNEKGWRLTEAGRRLLPETAPDETSALAPEHLRLLRDFYHYARISRHRGMMPKKLAKDYDADDLRDLFEHGYLLRIRVKGKVTAKGWLVSRKGLRALGQAETTPAPVLACAAPAAGDGPRATRAATVPHIKVPRKIRPYFEGRRPGIPPKPRPDFGDGAGKSLEFAAQGNALGMMRVPGQTHVHAFAVAGLTGLDLHVEHDRRRQLQRHPARRRQAEGAGAQLSGQGL